MIDARATTRAILGSVVHTDWWLLIFLVISGVEAKRCDGVEAMYVERGPKEDLGGCGSKLCAECSGKLKAKGENI